MKKKIVAGLVGGVVVAFDMALAPLAHADRLPLGHGQLAAR